MYNKDIRELMKENHVYQWEIAEQMSISEFTLTRWMRRELPDTVKAAIREAVREIIEHRKEG